MNNKISSIIDYVYPGIDPQVWTKDGNLLPEHRELILNVLYGYLKNENLGDPDLWIEQVKIIGGITTYQYTFDSDIDIHVRVNLPAFITINKPEMTEEQAHEYLNEFRHRMNKHQSKLPGTEHPIEYYFETPFVNIEGSPRSGLYDVVEDKWEIEPISIDKDFDIEEIKPLVVEIANKIAEEMDISFGKIKRHVRRMEEIQHVRESWTDEQKSVFDSKLQEKLQKVEEEIKSLSMTRDQIVEDRRVYDPEGDAEIKFKYLQKFGYLTIMTELQELLKDDNKITEDEIPEVKMILDEADTKPEARMIFGEDSWPGENKLIIDFDNTIADNSKVDFPNIGEPFNGVKEALEELKEKGWTLNIFSARSNDKDGTKAIKEFMEEHDLPYDEIVEGKPHAEYYIDDRAVEFSDWKQVLKDVNKRTKKSDFMPSISIHPPKKLWGPYDVEIPVDPDPSAKEETYYAPWADKPRKRDWLKTFLNFFRGPKEDQDKKAYSGGLGAFIDPNGKVYDIGEEDHSDWAQKNLNRWWVDLVKEGWSRVRVDDKTAYIEIADLKNIPSSVETFIFDHPVDVLVIEQLYQGGYAEISASDIVESGLQEAVDYYLRLSKPSKVAVKDFFRSPKEDEEQSKKAYIEPDKKVLENVLNIIKSTGGTTFNFSRGNLAGTDNYAVSIYPQQSLILDHEPTLDELNSYVQSNIDLLSDSDNSLGVWNEGGQYYLDVSVTIPDRDQAIELGKEHNQKGILNLENLEFIPTGGTGEDLSASSKLDKKSYTSTGYWVAPDGKAHEVRTGKVFTHSDWVWANAKFLIEQGISEEFFGKSKRNYDYYGAAAQMLEQGWARVGDISHGGLGIEVYNIRRIPDGVEDLLTNILGDGDIITVADLSKKAVEVTYPWKSLQKAVNRNLRGSLNDFFRSAAPKTYKPKTHWDEERLHKPKQDLEPFNPLPTTFQKDLNEENLNWRHPFKYMRRPRGPYYSNTGDIMDILLSDYDKVEKDVPSKEATEKKADSVVTLTNEHGDSFRVFENPTVEQAINILNKSHPDEGLRYFYSPDGKFFIWDGWYAEHVTVIQMLGYDMSYGDEGYDDNTGYIENEKDAQFIIDVFKKEKVMASVQKDANLLDHKDALDEIKEKSNEEINKETAITWGNRAVAYYHRILEEKSDLKEKFKWLADSEDFYRESLEHASGVEDTKFFADLHKEISAVRTKAHDHLESVVSTVNKTASIKKKAQQISYWVDPSGEEYDAEPSHIDWLVENSSIVGIDISKFDTGDEDDPIDFEMSEELMDGAIRNNWVRVFISDDQMAIKISDLKRPPASFETFFISNASNYNSIIVEDLGGNYKTIDEPELGFEKGLRRSRSKKRASTYTDQEMEKYYTEQHEMGDDPNQGGGYTPRDWNHSTTDFPKPEDLERYKVRLDLMMKPIYRQNPFQDTPPYEVTYFFGVPSGAYHGDY